MVRQQLEAAAGLSSSSNGEGTESDGGHSVKEARKRRGSSTAQRCAGGVQAGAPGIEAVGALEGELELEERTRAWAKEVRRAWRRPLVVPGSLSSGALGDGWGGVQTG